MLNGTVDIAVHSMKDVPTLLPKGIQQTAVLKRASTLDILVHKDLNFLASNGVVATGSLRRKAQWLNRYPKHTMVDLRGNVNLRLQKLEDNNWDGAIFAKAGLERIEVLPENHINLDWMIPAPAQGAMVVHTMINDDFCTKALQELNNEETDICTTIEREFLRTLEGGCTAPIGALAIIEDSEIIFNGVLFSLDGSQKIEVKESIAIADIANFGVICAREVLQNGGMSLMKEIKDQMKK